MTKGIELSSDSLNHLFNYDPKTGILTNRFTRSRRAKINQEAGTITAEGYKQCSINYKLYLVHRLIWVMNYGTDNLPKEIDHKDGNPSNNKLENLRDGDNGVNAKNRALPSNNSSGTLGVRYHKGSFEASIKVNGQAKYLGCYSSEDEAIKVRKIAEIKYNFSSTHGRTND